MIVILDNGHGIDTPGKRSPKGMLTEGNDVLFREYEFNRDIVRRVEQKLKGIIDTHILVPEIEDISLPTRCIRANAYYAKHRDSFLVSVHANGGRGTGYEIYTSKGDTPADPIAEFMYKRAKEDFPEFRMRKDTLDGDFDKEANFYILKYTDCPTVLPEFFFNDTEKDLKFIASTKGRERIARHLADAIVKYIKQY